MYALSIHTPHQLHSILAIAGAIEDLLSPHLGDTDGSGNDEA